MKNLRIAINGTGVAGPALAWWLKQYGLTPILFERAPALRTGGYIIDFWGVGYDIAERMGILGELQRKGYLIESLQLVDRRGQSVAILKTAALRSLLGNRFLSIARSDLAAILYRACDNVDTRFGTSITNVTEVSDGVLATLSNGREEKFDLVIGADGLHSEIRSLIFGPQEDCEQSLGAYVAAFTLSGYPVRNELTYMTHAVPKKMVARCSLRDDETLFMFTFHSDLVPELPQNNDEAKALLRAVFRDMEWEVPSILFRLDEAEDFYFDRVSQIHLDSWSQGRVALIGDAAGCVSLLAGEGTGLAIAEAYALAGELQAATGDYRLAFQNYEQKLKPFIKQKQKSALKMLPFFAPKNTYQLFLSRLVIRASSIPILSKFLMKDLLKDDIDLPDYSMIPVPRTQIE